MRFVLIAACALALTASLPFSAGAEENSAAVSSGSQTTDGGGCPGAANGAPCCATCQDKVAKGIDPSKSEGGCPCQRARKAREAAAAKAREAAAANQSVQP